MHIQACTGKKGGDKVGKYKWESLSSTREKWKDYIIYDVHNHILFILEELDQPVRKIGITLDFRNISLIIGGEK